MKPGDKWLKQWEKQREKLASTIDFNEYFTEKELNGYRLDTLSLGHVSLPNGRLIACDPLCGLSEHTHSYFQKTPVGEFPVTACVMLSDDDCARYAAVKVGFSDENAVRFDMALVGNEDLKEIEHGDIFGFSVDAGLGAFADKKTREAFLEFKRKFMARDHKLNLYDDYFADLFKKSSLENPKYQRKVGDWINWKIPDTDLHMPIFQSGYGDGFYPVYFGYTKKEKMCCAVIHFINIQEL